MSQKLRLHPHEFVVELSGIMSWYVMQPLEGLP